jgi:Leucine-rich repeat (LRR) protein
MTLDEIVAQIDEAAEKELTELDLSGLWLEELPPEIGKCTHLTDLKLSGNQITCIPESIGQLSISNNIRGKSNPISNLGGGNIRRLHSASIQVCFLRLSPPGIIPLDRVHAFNSWIL